MGLMSHIGKIGILTVETDLRIKVKVTDAKSAYGNELVLIEPIDGWGEKWVRLNRITIEVDHNLDSLFDD